MNQFGLIQPTIISTHSMCKHLHPHSVPCYRVVRNNEILKEWNRLKYHPKFLGHIVVLCFERRYPEENGVIRLNSNILAPYTLGCLCYCFHKTFQAAFGSQKNDWDHRHKRHGIC